MLLWANTVPPFSFFANCAFDSRKGIVSRISGSYLGIVSATIIGIIKPVVPVLVLALSTN